MGSWVARIARTNEKTLYHKIITGTKDPPKEYGEALKIAQEWFSLQEKVKVEYLLRDAIGDYLGYLEKEKSAAVYKTAAGVLKGIPESLQTTCG